MEWHTGNTLSQSVFTLLFVHQLAEINPDLLPPEIALKKDASHPIELITVVLRSAVFGLLKSCDMVWRELSKKRVHDVSIASLSFPSADGIDYPRWRIGKATNAMSPCWKVFPSMSCCTSWTMRAYGSDTPLFLPQTVTCSVIVCCCERWVVL